MSRAGGRQVAGDPFPNGQQDYLGGCVAVTKWGLLCGEKCEDERVFEFEDVNVPLCYLHLQRSRRFMEKKLKQHDVDLSEKKWDEQVRDRRAGLCYFARFADGRIKIGTSKNVDERMRQIATAKEIDRPVVLLTIPGGYDTEAAMHTKFAAYRHGMRETFDPSPELLTFIDTTRAKQSARAQ